MRRTESPSKRPMTAFQILSEPVRLFLIETLFVGEQTSGDLASLAHREFGISWSATSRHLVTLRRSGFARVIHDELTHWYVLEDGWLELVDQEVEALRSRWAELESIRRFGFSDLVPPVDDWPPDPFPERRGRRGRTAVDAAARGVGRSAESDDADGGGGLS
jgi:DNA-binding transcriptional ArsR family regulator